jgi:outer membrane immunogenic protein
MNKIAIGVATIAAVVGAPALAADMPVKAPPRAPAPIYSWTGWYVGGNVGYGWGHANSDLAGSEQFRITPPPDCCDYYRTVR